MTTAGWIFMVGSIGFVVGLTAFCFYRVLARPAAANHMTPPLEADTHDRNT
jgi:hypothetical protein